MLITITREYLRNKYQSVLKITVKKNPQGRKRKRFTVNKKTGRPRPYTELTDFDKAVFAAATKAAKEKTDAPLACHVVYYIADTDNKSTIQQHTKKPDVDNCDKAILDEVKGLYFDDSQISCCLSFKVSIPADGSKGKPRAEVEFFKIKRYGHV